MRIAQILIILMIAVAVAEAAVSKSAIKIVLGETEVRVNVYENPGAQVTFFAPHHNEQIGLNLAKDFIGKSGGRLIEIESFDERGNPSRHVKFKLNGKSYAVDPNRIYTENGRNCNVPAEINETVKKFAESLLQILFPDDGRTLRAGERFVVAVHNNADVSVKAAASQSSDLTAVAFLKAQSTKNLAHGVFEAQSDGVFISNTETDEDNFVFLSTPKHIGHFAAYGFNVVVQKSAAKLDSKQCALDDGSLSVYAAQNALEYICLEADAADGQARQRLMLEAVYALLPGQKPIEAEIVAGQK